MPVEDVRSKRSMCAEPLPAHGLCDTSIMLSHIPNVVAMRIEDDISICLFEAQKDVHHLDLSLYHDSRLSQ